MLEVGPQSIMKADDLMVTRKAKLNNPLVALRHKNFRYYWFGMCISLVGTWMQNIAQPWLVYSLTKSAFLLSVVGALQFTPIMLFSLFAGVIVDRYPKKRIIIFTQSSLMLITLILALLVWTGRVQYWHILITATAMGLVNTLDMPARQSFVIELVGKSDLLNAIALNSAIFNGARVIGPAIAGIIMGYAGITFCFLINSLSFAAVLVSLFFVKTKPFRRQENRDTNIMGEIKAGLGYIRQHRVLFNSILLVTIVGTFAMNFNVLVPVFAREVLKQGEAGFGFLISFMGLGSFTGAMLVASISKSGPSKKLLNILPICIGLFLIVTGLTRVYWLTAIGLALTGFFFITFTSTANSTIQLNSSDEYRGRVMSVYALVFAGSTPVGNLYAGAFAHKFGAGIGFIACGVIILLLLAVLNIRKNSEQPQQEPATE